MNFLMFQPYWQTHYHKRRDMSPNPTTIVRPSAHAPWKQTRISPRFSGEIRCGKFPLDQFFALVSMVSTIPTDFCSKASQSAFPPVSATPPSAVVAAPNVDNSISSTVEDRASPVERAKSAGDSAFPRSLRSFWEAVEDENE